MSNFPDFFEVGYQVERSLGQNRAGGRVTYLATSTNTQLPVVIKQFQFAQTGSNWSDYEAVNQEIQLLQELNHPSIPRYLDAFETPTGFCLVQEYKLASSLAQPHHWTPEEIKQIAVGVLEVLVYLQSACPPIIHRDIKPENILVDRQSQKVNLVDFGFARMGGEEVAVSSVVKGTLGFMPPEQLFNRQLTKASDLYSLGATLICLLTHTKSTQIGNLIDETYRINFKHLVPQLSPQFINWLEKMVAPSLKNRYPNAAAALEALGPIAVVGNATTLRMQVRTTKLRVAAPAAGLAALGLVSLLNTTSKVDLALYDPAYDNFRHLQATLQCPQCNLQYAQLEDADLQRANLGGADLQRANLGGADLQRADLAGANLESADLRHAALTRADLGYANLGYANLKRASLGSANLTLANLGGADLRSANLGGVNLTVANLRGADLKDANLGHANLAGANLENADLRGADLKSANLEDANLEGATMPDGTIHP